LLRHKPSPLFISLGCSRPQSQSSPWWYDSYTYLYFVGRKLLLRGWWTGKLFDQHQVEGMP
jgi:hypothetical protein